ncbi:MAG: Cu(I)-responsive transcriptional regulator [Natronospirillum sp.]|uniref:Cu(I)-responsive transcriptional regulator n=1 Tax=Natronospirillum sp. TaxID=2812955 RepID=UPI0025DD1DBE|nr:Cu(I)-responsive transcriptional regulator [Natronospirillum sp.]MCH8552852.1 Cu(I)-responsive transcriptional regulator [Natronospirillum sp.]
MRIGEAARKSGLPEKTIRYYESIGLLSSPRLGNGYRDYSARHVQALSFLRRARDIGFSIDECRSLLALHDDPERASADVKQVATQRLLTIDQHIDELRGMRKTLEQLVARCPGNDSADCAILHGLEEQHDTP